MTAREDAIFEAQNMMEIAELQEAELGALSEQMNESQEVRILHMLRMGRHLTPLAALNLVGCFRLAARIHSLRCHGHKIQSGSRKVGKKIVTEYWIEP